MGREQEEVIEVVKIDERCLFKWIFSVGMGECLDEGIVWMNALFERTKLSLTQSYHL